MRSDFPVHIFEEHSSVLPVWWQSGLQQMDVVYVDAHLDLQQLDPFKIERLASCQSVEQFKSLETPYYLNPSNAYSFGIENFLYPAARLGIMKRLFWVAPPHIPRSYSDAMLEHTQKMDGVSFSELTGFRQVGKSSMRGSLLGIEITICHFDDLENLDIGNHYQLDIDIDYFVKVPEDTIWVDPGEVVDSVLKQLGTPVMATVSHAVSSGYTPVSARFIASYVASRLTRNRKEEDLYPAILELHRKIGSGETMAADTRLDTLLLSYPDNPHLLYLASILCEDQQRSSQLAAMAAKIDPIYHRNLLRDAAAYPNRFKALHLSKLEALQQEFRSEKPDTQNHAHAATRTALALLQSRFGQIDEAIGVLQTLDGDYRNHFDLSMALGSILSRSKYPEIAQELLENARKRDKHRTEASFRLGELALQRKDIAAAINLFSEAHARAPAWLEPLQQLHRCYHMNADDSKRELVHQQLLERKAVLQNLLR